MPNITVITPPDKLFNNNKTILLIYPSDTLKTEFQTVVQDWEIDFNLYIYALEPTEHDFDWLLTVSKLSDIVIFDIDNSASEVRDLTSYLVANTNTFWLTNSIDPVYNKLSMNRIFDLSFLKQGEDNGV